MSYVAKNETVSIIHLSNSNENTRMLSPSLAIAGVALCLAASIALYRFNVVDPTSYFYFPIFFLIAYHTITIQFVIPPARSKNSLTVVLKKSVGKYIFWLSIIFGAYWVYTNHPFYANNAPHTAIMVQFYLKAYAIFGLPYFFFVERYRTTRFEWLNDPYIKFLSMVKVTYKRQWQSLRHRILKKGYKSVLLSWLIRLHFLPVMVEQVYWGTRKTLNFIEQSPGYLYDAMFFVAILFLVDAINASIGYFWESAVTRTRFRAVDPNTFHWVVVMCYVPFIGFAGTFIPFPNGQGDLVFTYVWFEPVVNFLTVIALLGIVVSTTSLGFSYSNLSFKKIQTQGPYRIVRHPGTVFKISFFFLTVFRFEASFTVPIIAAYGFWMGIYIVRILCEERFLLRFKEYEDYAKVTRYRLLPGVW